MARLSRLPTPVADAWDWQLRGACRGRDSTEFFKPDDEPASSRRRREVDARALCARCPVRPECAAHALAARERHGIWGGFTGPERLRLLALGWEDLADSGHVRVDIAGLEARLGREHAVARTPRRGPGPLPTQSTPARSPRSASRQRRRITAAEERPRVVDAGFAGLVPRSRTG